MLLRGREAPVEGEHLGTSEAQITDRLGGVADLALTRAEDQNITIALDRQLDHGVRNSGRLVSEPARSGILQGPVTHLDGVRPPRHLNYRSVVEVRREPRRVDGRRGDDDLEIGPPRQQPLDVPEQEVDV